MYGRRIADGYLPQETRRAGAFHLVRRAYFPDFAWMQAAWYQGRGHAPRSQCRFCGRRSCAVDGNSGYDNSFWTSDGTAAGTIRLASIFPSQANNLNEISRQFCVSNNALYFAAFSYDYGNELWKTDGTVAGTVLVKDINPGYADARPSYLTDVNGVLFFTADDGVNGNELWATNGKPNKTGLIKDLTPGISPSYFDGFCSIFGRVIGNTSIKCFSLTDNAI